MNDTIKAVATAAGLALLLAFAGCEQDGPMENAGEEVDEAFDTQGGAEDVGEEVDEAVDELGESAEEAADELEQQ
ncbi:MAG TPA: hypothetical protein VLT59_13110 [Steroidobacteraceae bacterium]|nr:hypothetical protein [Steroidobacteraceae bacterium]